MTGAAGKTGALVVKKLLARPADFSVVALVRSSKVGRRWHGCVPPLLLTLGG